MRIKPCFLLFIIVVILIAGYKISQGSDDKKENGRENIKLDIPIKSFLAQPKEGSKSVYDVPIGVRLIECTPDKKWYKVRISYNFIGYFEYSGWCKVE